MALPHPIVVAAMPATSDVDQVEGAHLLFETISLTIAASAASVGLRSRERSFW
jgi:hypothetical protein